jgi:hypothetical protein
MGFDIHRRMIESVKDIKIEETRAQIACMLNELWHSRLPDIHWSNVVRNKKYVCYVFKYKQAIVGTAIWSSPVAANRFKNGWNMLELRRMALSDVCPKNTATYTISQMIKQIKIKFPDLVKLVSYQDKEVHLGTIYKASNWVAATDVPLLDWNTSKRKRNNLQSTSAKVRWEYSL